MKIHYLTGSRADFGLMQHCLQTIADSPNHDLGIVVTGQHTTKKYGSSINDIVCSGLPIIDKIQVSLTGKAGSEMAFALADELTGLTRLWQKNRPDLVLLLGDRGEMLAGALAAVHLGIHTAHIHGGERTGTLDEGIRHAISKLSHLHFPATEESQLRLIKMGEDPSRIFVIGAPGLVNLSKDVISSKKQFLDRFEFLDGIALALCVYHPVVQDASDAGTQMRALVEATRARGYAQIILRPNSDAGGMAIDHYLDSLAEEPTIRVLDHLERTDYLNLLASVDLMVGNSSSGIIESASFGTRCLNIGDRQNDRQRNSNTIDCPSNSFEDISQAIVQAENLRYTSGNVYGDGKSHLRLLSSLDSLILKPEYLAKRNSY